MRELYSSITSDDIFGRSAQLAYYFFFALFPGFIFLSAILAILSGSSLRDTLMLHLPRLLPADAFQLVQKTFMETTHGGSKLTFGIVVALWSATVGMSAACDTLNAVHDVKESRPYWRVQLTALTVTLVATLLVLCAIAVFFVGDAMIQLFTAGSFHIALMVLIRAAQWGIVFFLIALVFAMIYYFAPDVREREWHWITPGATFGILLWILATIAFRIYLHFFHSYSVTYGSLGAVIILLTWFYVSGFALLTGAEVNATVENAAAEEGNPRAVAKGEKYPNAA